MIYPKYEYEDLPLRQRKNVKAALSGEHPEWTDALNEAADMLGTGMTLSLLGTRGTGKTQLAVCLCYYAARRKMSFRYVTAYEMFSSIKETYRDDSKTGEAGVMAYLNNCGLLIIDELNEANRTTWEGHILSHLIDLRYQKERDTVMISNYTREQFNEAVGDSIVSRMDETGGYIECRWDSFRKQKKGAVK